MPEFKRKLNDYLAHAKLIFTLVLVLPSTQVYADNCGSRAHVALQVLGSGGPELTDELASTSYLIWYAGKARILIDTGPGSSTNFEKAKAQFEDLDAILYTHLHADHSSALPGFIKGSYFTSRDSDLMVFGPNGNKLLPAMDDFLVRMFGSDGIYPYLADMLSSNEDSSSFKLIPIVVSHKADTAFATKLNKNIQLKAINTEHGPIPALAWRIDIEDISIIFTGDTTNLENHIQLLGSEVDMLVAHNAIPQKADGIAAALHMRPSDITNLTSAINPRQLLLSHFMRRSIESRDQILSFLSNEHVKKIPLIIAEDMGCYPLSHNDKTD